MISKINTWTGEFVLHLSTRDGSLRQFRKKWTICFHYPGFSSGIEMHLVTAAADSIFRLTRVPGDWIQVVADSILRLTRVLVAGYELWLCRVQADGYKLRLSRVLVGEHKLQLTPSYGTWMQLKADCILWLAMSCSWLTRVPAAGNKLQLTISYSWLELRKLDASYSWFHPAVDYELRVILSCHWFESTGWTRLLADLYFNKSSKFKNLFCKIHHFCSLFSTACFQLPLIRALPTASRTLKKLEEVAETWRSFKTLAATDSIFRGWFELWWLIRDLWPIEYLLEFDPNAPW